MRPKGAVTVGSMDLGGASTQIAFAVQEHGNGSDYMHVKLYGYPYYVYTHSFLCYGKNEAEKRVLDKVVQVLCFASVCTGKHLTRGVKYLYSNHGSSFDIAVYSRTQMLIIH